MDEKEVLIIGAGIAGLTAAYDLARAGWKVTILEGRDRSGGRLWTRLSRHGLPLELGAEFIHGEKVATWEFIREAGLRTESVPERHWHNWNGRLEEADSFANALDQLAQESRASAKDISVKQLLDTSPGLSSYTRWFLEQYVEGFHAADPAQMSVQSFVEAEKTSEKEGACPFRITGGYGALLQWLNAQLTDRAVKLRLDTIARRVRWRRGHVEIHACTAGAPQTFTAARAIVTVPVGVLTGRGTAGVVFEPDLPEKAQPLKGVLTGGVTKVLLEFKRRFWPETPGFIHSTDQWLPTWWADDQNPLLTGWVGGLRSDRLNAMDQTSLAAKAVTALSAIFAIDPGKIRAELTAVSVHHWNLDPFSCGAYGYLKVGQIHAQEQLAAPLEQTLYFAGEATAGPGKLGTVHGALESGRRAAAALIEG